MNNYLLDKSKYVDSARLLTLYPINLAYSSTSQPCHIATFRPIRGCTDAGRFVPRATVCSTVAPYVCGSWVWNSLYVILPVLELRGGF